MRKVATKNKPEIATDSPLMTIREYARTTGDSEAGIRGRIATRSWVEGEHYLRKRRRIRLNVAACNKWWATN